MDRKVTKIDLEKKEFRGKHITVFYSYDDICYVFVLFVFSDSISLVPIKERTLVVSKSRIASLEQF